jgi:hypothetical protein
MNKAFYVVLFFSIVLIFSTSVYLINRKAPPQPLSNQPGFTQIYTPKPGGRVFTATTVCIVLVLNQVHNRAQNILCQSR